MFFRQLAILIFIIISTQNIATPQSKNVIKKNYTWQKFVMGSDLSYVNQIEDAGGVYKVNGEKKDVYTILK